MAKLMLLESDPTIGKNLELILTAAGHDCVMAPSMTEALGHVLSEEERFVTLIDTRISYSEGLELLTALQKRNMPVLFLTRTPANAAHLRALYRRSCGVVTLPLKKDELLRAVDDILTDSNEKMTVGDLQLDLKKHAAIFKGADLDLTAQEFALLRTLMSSPENAVSREELLRKAWGYQTLGETRTVDVHVQRLRRKLGAASIETVYKMGYKLHLA